MNTQQTMIANLKHAARTGGASIGGGDFSPAECREAAAVLESAQELLAALQEVVDAYQRHFDVMPIVWQTIDDIASAAIAKAKGE